MFGKKKQVAKPSKVKIEIAFDNCKSAIQDLLNQYQATIEGYLNKIVQLKREKRITEAARYKDKLKLVLARQAKMQDIMDQVEQFQYMVDEVFAKSAVYKSMEAVLGETNKFNLSVEMKKMLKDINAFDDIFTKGVGKLDSVFGRVSKKISDIDQSSSVQDSEIDAIVAGRLDQYDQQTTYYAEEGSLDPFHLS